MQINLQGKPAPQRYSCCNCPWEGYLSTEEERKKENGIYSKSKIYACPKCGWALWEIEKVNKGQQSNIYSAFKKKYGE